MTFPIAKNGHSMVIRISWSYFISNTMKSIGKIHLPTFTNTFSGTPLGCLIKRLTSYSHTVVGLASLSLSFLHTESSMKFTFSSKSHKAFSKLQVPLVQSIWELPGSFQLRWQLLVQNCTAFLISFTVS